MTTSRTAPQAETGGKPFYDLLGFARLFLRTHSITRHEDIRTEVLAEAFRHHMGLPPFPTLAQLLRLCRELEIELEDLPTGSALPGANTSYGSTNKIFLRPDLPKRFTETTFGHELREVIERAFQQVAPWYQGLDTSDNKQMHPESEHFALCLLMQAEATHQRLCELGFDIVRFATERERSLPSVFMRVQNLYGGANARPGPVAGVWLFQAPSPRATGTAVAPKALKVRYTASLRGFSTDKSGSPCARRAHLAFPKMGASAAEHALAQRAVEQRQPQSEEVSLLDLFGEENYLVAAEPLLKAGSVHRVMVTAVRQDSLALVDPWLARLGLNAA